MFQLRNPLPKIIQDNDDLKQVIGDYNLVPYRGDTKESSHGYLQLLCEFYELGGSHANCINDIKQWAFEGDIQLFPREIPGLKLDRNPISQQQAKQIFESFENIGFSFIQLIDLTKQLFTSYKTSGNAWLYYQEIESGDVRKVVMYHVHPKHVMYLNSEEGEARSVVITKCFDSQHLNNPDKHRLVRVYPDFTESRGKKECVFHIKNEIGESDWYGLPDSLQALFWMYSEYALSNLACKVNGTDIVTKNILAFKSELEEADPQGDDDRQDNHRARMNALRRLTTNKGGIEIAESLAGIEYDDEAPTLFKLDVNRDTAWFKEQSDKASRYIFSAHRCFPELMGFTESKSGIGADQILNMFAVFNEKTVRPYQELFSRMWSMVFRVIAEFTGSNQINEVSVGFPNRIDSLIQSMKDVDTQGSNIVE